jgi:hypothetical protein
VSKTALTRDAGGTFTVMVSAVGSGTNWIPVGSSQFSLTLRLYNPGPGIVLDPTHAALPALKRVSCT